MLLNAAHLLPGSVIGRPLASCAGWGGGFTPAHSERHTTQDLGSTCPLARCSARSSMQQTCTNPPGAQDVYPHVIVPRPRFRVKWPTVVCARCFYLLPRTPLHLLVVFAVVHVFLPLRDRRPPISCQLTTWGRQRCDSTWKVFLLLYIIYMT